MYNFRKSFIFFVLFPLMSLIISYASPLNAYEERDQNRQFNQQHTNQHHNDYNRNNYNHAGGYNNYHRGNDQYNRGNANINVNPNNNSTPQYVEPLSNLISLEIGTIFNNPLNSGID